MTPAVVIEIAAPHGSSAHVAALVGACSQAVPEGECALSTHEGEPGGTTRVAIVAWDGPEHRAVRIEVGVPSAGRATWLVRDLQFRTEDAEVERWRSVGLVIATLVGESRAQAEPPPAPAPPPPIAPPPAPSTDRPAPPLPPAAAPARPWIWIDGGLTLGPAAGDGTYRLGALLRGAHPFVSVPLLGLASLRYAARPADDAGLGVQWLSGTVGLGGHVELAAGIVALDARAEIGAELQQASVTDPATGATDSGARWIGVSRFGADGAWMLHRNVGLLLGIDASLAQSATVLRIRSQPAARIPPFTVDPSLGVRVALP